MALDADRLAGAIDTALRVPLRDAMIADAAIAAVRGPALDGLCAAIASTVAAAVASAVVAEFADHAEVALRPSTTGDGAPVAGAQTTTTAGAPTGPLTAPATVVGVR